jgi:hypothetical protein
MTGNLCVLHVGLNRNPVTLADVGIALLQLSSPFVRQSNKRTLNQSPSPPDTSALSVEGSESDFAGMLTVRKCHGLFTNLLRDGKVICDYGASGTPRVDVRSRLAWR